MTDLVGLVSMGLNAAGRLPDTRVKIDSSPSIRQAAYIAFAGAVWRSVSGLQALRAFAPEAVKPIAGIMWRPHLLRALEAGTRTQGDLLAEYERIRLVAPDEVLTKANLVLDQVGELAARITAPANEFEDTMALLGSAQRGFVQACRLDLRYEAARARPPYGVNPLSWIRRLRWNMHNRRVSR